VSSFVTSGKLIFGIAAKPDLPFANQHLNPIIDTDMHRRYEKIYSPALERDIQLLAFGHYGLPVIAFPSGGGQFHDFEDNGMVGAIAHLIDAGKIKLYCPESIDHESWLNHGLDPHWRAVRYNAYQDFLINNLVPAIRFDCQAADIKIALTGCSLGAYHAANFALKFPHIFHYALCMSGRYDVEGSCESQSDSMEVYFHNPLAYVYNLHNDDLEQVRRQTHIVLVCGQGAWEDQCLPDTHRLADLFVEKGISHERDIWGHDVEHHWYWWRRQIIYHFGKALA
jgi:esterase/lipase superfamily enzyme